MDTEEKVLTILKDCGISIDKCNNFKECDSILFISALIAIEKTFAIEFPDEYLTFDRIHSYKDLVIIIETLMC